MIEADPMGPALIDIQAIRTGATEMDSSPYSSLTESSSSVSVITDTELMLPFSFESSSRAQGSCRGRSPSHSLPPALDLLANRLEFRDTIFLMAMLRNASALGFNIDDVGSCRYDTMSPLYSPATPASDPAGLLSYWGRRQRNAALPPDLQPTLNQMLIPHHVSLDLIPFPALRDRIIVLSAAMPATFNMWELKLDIYTRGGLTVVRGKGSGASKGGFQPWDRRSWVATPWFLRKWKLLVEEDREQLGRGE